ncbi:hypothetical protein P3T40_005564 [Paraburkholderia sp. EB58]|jgi:hypothetical protein
MPLTGKACAQSDCTRPVEDPHTRCGFIALYPLTILPARPAGTHHDALLTFYAGGPAVRNALVLLKEVFDDDTARRHAVSPDAD